MGTFRWDRHWGIWVRGQWEICGCYAVSDGQPYTNLFTSGRWNEVEDRLQEAQRENVSKWHVITALVFSCRILHTWLYCEIPSEVYLLVLHKPLTIILLWKDFWYQPRKMLSGWHVPIMISPYICKLIQQSCTSSKNLAWITLLIYKLNWQCENIYLFHRDLFSRKNVPAIRLSSSICTSLHESIFFACYASVSFMKWSDEAVLTIRCAKVCLLAICQNAAFEKNMFPQAVDPMQAIAVSFYNFSLIWFWWNLVVATT